MHQPRWVEHQRRISVIASERQEPALTMGRRGLCVWERQSTAQSTFQLCDRHTTSTLAGTERSETEDIHSDGQLLCLAVARSEVSASVSPVHCTPAPQCHTTNSTLYTCPTVLHIKRLSQLYSSRRAIVTINSAEIYSCIDSLWWNNTILYNTTKHHILTCAQKLTVGHLNLLYMTKNIRKQRKELKQKRTKTKTNWAQKLWSRWYSLQSVLRQEESPWWKDLWDR